MRRMIARVRAAWRVLRFGPDAGSREPVTYVEISRVRLMVQRSLLLVGLPYEWAETASSAELELVRAAMVLALAAREADWGRVERGGWPTPTWPAPVEHEDAP